MKRRSLSWALAAAVLCAGLTPAGAAAPAHTHTWGAYWDFDDYHHWRGCSDPDCRTLVPSQAEGYDYHVYDDPWDSTCNVCGWVRAVDPFHTHAWGEGWSGDDTCHWHVCTDPACPGVASEEAPGYGGHLYDGPDDPSCNVCGWERILLPSGAGHLYGPSGEQGDVEITGRGRVLLRPDNPGPGDTVTVVLLPERGYAAGTAALVTKEGETALSGEDGVFTFTQTREKVKLRAVFLPAYQVCPRDERCPAASFGDLSPAQWYHDGVHYCLDWGLMSGYDQTRFVPDAPLSGGMMAQILYNLSRRPPVPQGGGYQPAGAWYDEAAAWAAGAGVLDVDGSSRLDLEQDVTREQVAVMLWRYAGKPAGPGWALAFPDASAISPWAREAVAWAAQQGILRGTDGGRLEPGGRTTRAEAACMLVRFLEGAGQ